MNDPAVIPEVFSLWFRKSRAEPWRCVFTGPTSQSCTDYDPKCGSGDYYTTRGTARPT